jgi:hypothetical protein
MVSLREQQVTENTLDTPSTSREHLAYESNCTCRLPNSGTARKQNEATVQRENSGVFCQLCRKSFTEAGPTTSTTTTVAKRFRCRQCSKTYQYPYLLREHIEAVHVELRHRCPNARASSQRKVRCGIIFTALLVHESRFSAIDVESAFQRDWLAEHKVWHIEADLDRYFKCAYFNYCASAADVRTHILADHVNNQPFKITIESIG